MIELNLNYKTNILFRYDLINYFIKKYSYTKYLEIGVATGENITKIQCDSKIGVDPVPKCSHVTYPIISDEFFGKNTNTFDIIFIDGLHTDKQVDKDIENSLNILNDNGTIILHDCNPPTEDHGKDEWILAEWNGTVWKSIVKQRCLNSNINVTVVDIDWGCGVIRRGSQELYTKNSLDECLQYPIFSKNRTELLNLISPNDVDKIV